MKWKMECISTREKSGDNRMTVSYTRSAKQSSMEEKRNNECASRSKVKAQCRRWRKGTHILLAHICFICNLCQKRYRPPKTGCHVTILISVIFFINEERRILLRNLITKWSGKHSSVTKRENSLPLRAALRKFTLIISGVSRMWNDFHHINHMHVCIGGGKHIQVEHSGMCSSTAVVSSLENVDDILTPTRIILQTIGMDCWSTLVQATLG